MSAGPQPAAFASPGAEIGEDRSDDATSASYTELPASYKPVPRRKPGTGASGPAGSGWRRWLRSHMAWAGWASVGAALVVVGVILGAALSSSSVPTSGGSKQASGALPPRPVAPETVCGTSASHPRPRPVHAEHEHGHRRCRVGRPGSRLRSSDLRHGLLTWDSPPSFAPNQTFHRTAQIKPLGRTGRDRAPGHQPALPQLVEAGSVHRRGTGPGGSAATTTFIVNRRRPSAHGLSSGSTTGLPGGSARPGRPAGSGRRR